VDAEELVQEVRFHSLIDPVKGDFFKGAADGGAAGSRLHRQDTVLAQGADDVPYHHRIASGRESQQTAGHPGGIPVVADEDETVDCDGTFRADMHSRSPCVPGQLSGPSKLPFMGAGDIGRKPDASYPAKPDKKIFPMDSHGYNTGTGKRQIVAVHGGDCSGTSPP